MLVLSRKAGEKLHIGADITITVLEIQGNKMRVGIEAPDAVKILRAELRDLLALASDAGAAASRTE